MTSRRHPPRHGLLSVTPDLVTPLERVLEKAKELGLKIGFQPSEEDPTLSPQYSMANTGREVHIFIETEDLILEQELGLVWGMAVPLGFTPFSRYPLPGPRQGLFHFLGPWALLYERLLAEGRGEVAWPSVCVAAQCDIDKWEGSKRTERNVQAQLHRTGINCGPVDGIIGPRTVSGLKAARLSDLPLGLAEEELISMPTAVLKKTKKAQGHLVLPNTEFSVNTFGHVSSTRVNKGAVFSIRGPGRIVVDVE